MVFTLNFQAVHIIANKLIHLTISLLLGIFEKGILFLLFYESATVINCLFMILRTWTGKHRRRQDSSPNPSVPVLPSVILILFIIPIHLIIYVYKSLQSKLEIIFELSTHSHYRSSARRGLVINWLKLFILGTRKWKYR